MKKKNIENAIKQIKDLLKESDNNSDDAATGYDKGWYVGESNAYSKALDILNEAIK